MQINLKERNKNKARKGQLEREREREKGFKTKAKNSRIVRLRVFIRWKKKKKIWPCEMVFTSKTLSLD